MDALQQHMRRARDFASRGLVERWKNMGISYWVLHPSNRKWIITPSTIEVLSGNL